MTEWVSDPDEKAARAAVGIPDRASASMNRWRGVIAVEGVVTDDGRLIKPMAMTWSDDRAIPLMTPMRRGSEGAWNMPVVGHADSVERVERDGRVLIQASGTLSGDLPAVLDLSAVVDNATIACEGVDHPMEFTSCRLRQIVVGSERVWDECVLEVIEDAESMSIIERVEDES